MLSYYFIKKRKVWDSIFSLEAIQNSITELLMCPEHFLIWLPFIDFENTICVEEKKQSDDARDNIKKVLEHISIIMKDMVDVNIDGSGLGSGGSSCGNIKKIKWILEGTLKDFDKMYDETSEFYNKLAGSYDILNDKVKKGKDGKDGGDSVGKNTILLLEDLVFIDNNIEVSNNISSILSIFTENDYKLLFQIENGYMSSFLYDFIENIRIYRLSCMMKMDV